MAKNTDLLLDTLNRVEGLQFPEWNQKCWTGCFGAHAIQEYGYEVSSYNKGDGTEVHDASGAFIGGTKAVATEILGLSELEASVLFAANNTKAQLRGIVEALIFDKVSDEDWQKVADFELNVSEVLADVRFFEEISADMDASTGVLV
jgi:hypothetical protein